MSRPTLEEIAAHVEKIRAAKPDARSWNEEAILVLWEEREKGGEG